MTDLLEAIATRRDHDAFVELYAYFAPRVKTFLLRSGTSEARADELAQETMLIVWRKANSFTSRGIGVAGWIFSIARNLQIDAIRHERRLAYNLDESDANFASRASNEESPEDRTIAAHLEARVRDALKQLSPEQTRVVPSGMWLGFTRRDLQRREVIWSCGEVNWLIDGLGSERLPAINFAHVDLARGKQRPEQHRCGVGRWQHSLRLDPALELLVQPLDGVGGANAAPLARR